MDKGKLSVAFGFLFVAAYVLWEIETKFAAAGVASGHAQTNAALFPRAIAIGLFLVTAVWIIQIVAESRRVRKSHPAATEPSVAATSRPNRQSALILTITLAYIALVGIVGYLALTPVALVAMFGVLGVRNILQNAIISILVTFAVWYLFGELMNIILPVGQLGWYL